MPKKSKQQLSKDKDITLDSFADDNEQYSTSASKEQANDIPQQTSVSNNTATTPNRRYIYKDGSITTVVYDGKNTKYIEVKQT